MKTSTKLKTISAISLLTILSILFSYFIIINGIWHEKTLPNTYLAAQDISLKSSTEVQQIYNSKYVVPDQIQIKIGNHTEYLDPDLVELDYNITSKEILASGKGPKEINNSIQTITQSKIFEPKPELNQQKLNDWMNKKFDLEILQPKISPEIIFENQSNAIKECTVGISAINLPYEQVANNLTIERIPKNIEVNLNYEFLTENESIKSRLCKDYHNLKSDLQYFQNVEILSIADVEKIFKFIVENQNLKILISDQTYFSKKLEEAKFKIETRGTFPKTILRSNKTLFVGEHKKGKQIDIEASILNTQLKLSNQNLNSEINELPIVLKPNNLPQVYNGNRTEIYPKQISSGVAKFPINSFGWGSREYTINNIKNGLDELNGYVIAPGQEFSTIEAIDAKLIEYNPETQSFFSSNPLGEPYGAGICGVSTILFRASLEAGLEITERHNHGKALNNYKYPYGGMIDAALYLRNDQKQDLKFINNTNYPIVISAKYWLKDNKEFNYQIDFYSTEDFVTRNVQIQNIKQEGKSYFGSGFTETFEQKVDGRITKFEGKYYSSDF